MDTHIKAVGIIYFVLGVMGLCAGIMIALLMLLPGFLSGDITALSINGALGAMMAALLFLFHVPAIIGGVGLLRRSTWARTVIIVLSLFNLLAFPVGTAAGGYALWVLFSDEGKGVFATA